jgi:hypothetical protein
VNQYAPSGPAVMPSGWAFPVKMGNSTMAAEQRTAVPVKRQMPKSAKKTAARLTAAEYKIVINPARVSKSSLS